MLRRWRVKRSGDRIRIHLDDRERDLVGQLMGQLRQLLDTEPGADDDRLRRVFPTAYPDDPERDAEYQRYMREEIVASHLGAIERVEASLGADSLTEAEAMAWTRGLNSVRLVLGTILDISEDTELSDVPDDDPAYGTFALYAYLSGLLDDVVTALSD